MTHILLVEDDFLIAQSIEKLLQQEHIDISWCSNASDGLAQLAQAHIDLVLLDIALPGMNGFELLSKIRAKYTTPVIAISAKDQVEDRLNILQRGGDDYLVKPFDFNELIARIYAVLRRSQPQPLVEQQRLQYKGVVLDLAQHSATWQNQPLDLSKKEWGLLETFLQQPKKIFSKADLEEKLYEFGQEINSNTVEVYVHRLRQKLDKELIKTIRGFGYKLN